MFNCNISPGKIRPSNLSCLVLYVHLAPETYVELLNTFGDHSEDEQLIIIERLRKCHHPSLAEGNKEKLKVSMQ